MKQFLRECLKPSQLGIAFLCASLGSTVFSLRPKLIDIALKTDATVDYAGRAALNLKAASEALKAAAENESTYLNTTLPQVTSYLQGTITGVNSLVSDLRGTVGKFNAATDGATEVLKSTKTDLDALKPVIDDLVPVETQVTATIPEVKLAFVNLNALATSSDVKGTLANVHGMTTDMHGVTTDGAQFVHDLTHPTKKHGTLFILQTIWNEVKPHVSLF